MGDNQLIITKEPTTFDIHLKYEIYFIIKHNELLAEHTIKNEVIQ